jgi:hypothetical protein
VEEGWDNEREMALPGRRGEPLGVVVDVAGWAWMKKRQECAGIGLARQLV